MIRLVVVVTFLALAINVAYLSLELRALKTSVAEINALQKSSKLGSTDNTRPDVNREILSVSYFEKRETDEPFAATDTDNRGVEGYKVVPAAEKESIYIAADNIEREAYLEAKSFGPLISPDDINVYANGQTEQRYLGEFMSPDTP